MTNLKKYRESQSLTLRIMAAKLNISIGYMHDLETGRRPPSPKLALKIGRITGIPSSNLRPDIFGPKAGEQEA